MTKASSSSKPSATHHVILVGSGGVGKTALAKQLVAGSFSPDYCPTRADSYSKVMSVAGERCTIDILDTAGQESFCAMRDNYYRSGEGFMCVFSITERHSFEAVQKQHELICRATDKEEPICLLVGNKADLQDQRQVTVEEAKRLASHWGRAVYMEVSAKESLNVREAFETLVKWIQTEKKEQRLKSNAVGLQPEDSTSCACIIQ